MPQDPAVGPRRSRVAGSLSPEAPGPERRASMSRAPRRFSVEGVAFVVELFQADLGSIEPADNFALQQVEEASPRILGRRVWPVVADCCQYFDLLPLVELEERFAPAPRLLREPVKPFPSGTLA